jgi:hypothetical protein
MLQPMGFVVYPRAGGACGCDVCDGDVGTSPRRGHYN